MAEYKTLGGTGGKKRYPVNIWVTAKKKESYSTLSRIE